MAVGKGSFPLGGLILLAVVVEDGGVLEGVVQGEEILLVDQLRQQRAQMDLVVKEVVVLIYRQEKLANLAAVLAEADAMVVELLELVVDHYLEHQEEVAEDPLLGVLVIVVVRAVLFNHTEAVVEVLAVQGEEGELEQVLQELLEQMEILGLEVVEGELREQVQVKVVEVQEVREEYQEAVEEAVEVHIVDPLAQAVQVVEVKLE